MSMYDDYEFIVIGVDPNDDNRAITITGRVFDSFDHAHAYAKSCHADLHAYVVWRPRLGLGDRYPTFHWSASDEE